MERWRDGGTLGEDGVPGWAGAGGIVGHAVLLHGRELQQEDREAAGMARGCGAARGAEGRRLHLVEGKEGGNYEEQGRAAAPCCCCCLIAAIVILQGQK